MPNGKGALECWYCVHYRNKGHSKPIGLRDLQGEVNAFLRHVEGQATPEHYKQVKDVLYAFADYFMDDAQSEERCEYHGVPLPSYADVPGHRICRNFSPTEEYQQDNPAYEVDGVDKRITVAERFAWFEITLQPGMLYVFHYNYPPGIEEWGKLSDKP